MADTDDDLLFARGPAASPFGKCSEMTRTLLPFDVKEKFVRMGHELGLSESEFLRELVMIRVYGMEHVRKIHEERLKQVAGIEHE